MPDQITGERLTRLFRPRSVALVGASDKSTFSMLAHRNLVEFGFGAHTYLVSRRGAQTHGRPTVTSCVQIGEPVDVAYLMVPQPGLLKALDDAAAAGIRNAGMQAASGPTAYINQVMQPVTDITRASMEHGRVPYVIPGLRQAMVALHNVAWWSQLTQTRAAEREPVPVPPRSPARSSPTASSGSGNSPRE